MSCVRCVFCLFKNDMARCTVRTILASLGLPYPYRYPRRRAARRSGIHTTMARASDHAPTPSLHAHGAALLRCGLYAASSSALRAAIFSISAF